MRESKEGGKVHATVSDAIALLRENATVKDMDNLERFGINPKKPIGVSMANIQRIAKQLGQSHGLAEALWKSGWYEARMLATFVEEPASVTPAQMDRWCRDFNNWGICDTVCFKLFDRLPAAQPKVKAWAGKRGEFQKRAGFALLACIALHNKDANEKFFLDALALIEREATDDRNFVKKAVSWALRSIGRRTTRLRKASLVLARRLAASDDAAARWIGKDAIRDLGKA